jgi:hypothetical protein
MIVINDHASQALPVTEAFHDTPELLVRTPFKGGLNNFPEALS